jgi:uncharacterized membrane protein YcjF (UPF0283 family)
MGLAEVFGPVFAWYCANADKADAEKKALQADKDALIKALHESELECLAHASNATLKRQELDHKLLWRTIVTAAVVCITLAVGAFIYLQKQWDSRCVIDKSGFTSLQFEYLALKDKIHVHKLETLQVEHLDQSESKDKAHKEELERLQFDHLEKSKSNDKAHKDELERLRFEHKNEINRHFLHVAGLH